MSGAAGPQLGAGGGQGRVGPAAAGARPRGPRVGTQGLLRQPPPELAVCWSLVWMQAWSLELHSQGLRGSKSVTQAPHQSFSGPPCGSQARPRGLAPCSSTGRRLLSVNYVLSTPCGVRPPDNSRGYYSPHLTGGETEAQ